MPPAVLFVMLGMDTLKFPLSHGYEELITLIDYTSDFGDAYPVRGPKGTVNGGHVVKAVKRWITYFGKPQFIVLDNASYFVKGDFEAWCAKERIQLIPASLYTPEANGKIENFNGQLQYTLARITLAREARANTTTETVAKKWYPHLQDALRVRNNHVSRVIGISPYQFVFGQEPPSVAGDQLTTDIIEELQEQRMQDLELVRFLREHATAHRIQNRMEERGEDLPAPRAYKEGDLVWYYQKDQDQGIASVKKILPRWKGPYQISLALQGGAYLVVDGAGKRVGNGTINHRCLAPVRTPPEWYEHGNLGCVERMASLVGEFRSEEVGYGRGLFA